MKKIRLSKSCIGEQEKQAVMAVLDKEYLGMGEEVQKFELALSDYFSRPAICVSTGTAALQLALEAMDIGAGDEVLVPSLTYVASFQAISATGAKPIACDIDEENLSINVEDVKRKITKQTRAIMIVHYSGFVGNYDSLMEVAKAHKLRVVEDAAHAFGSSYKGKKVGSFGDVTCFSFDGIKNITSGEGGCIVSNDQQLLERCRDARLLGVEKDTEARYRGQRSWDFDVTRQGWRYHMSNIMAAIGLAQFQRHNELGEKRKKLVHHYIYRLTKCDFVFPICQDYSESVPHIFVVKLAEEVDRDIFRANLLERGIESGVHYKPNHLLSLYSSSSCSTPILDKVFPRLLTLPLHPDMSLSDVDYIVDTINELVL
ncbi:DegT/DnrJ/EryC1/StrS family aminotransferase [Vibrio vulnificus]|nr:DegT/DnrJ/EryC1/StrS family aminotransferase [Vibrio vulnificus]EGR0093543.1 DegT/DnrJ/EryC1/StrS family aminotransferase [Vibrio vulnificus]EID4337917.1 DegT/DnrJ/EryC1/StrS family aminotransferase [Vibrio vulnificus]ELH4920304.1 DegT/DnrJ/EryC1/StrS family aminotransferase [Vibrio vulnificus]MCU8295519.1 DegT/DnrJ/EryC1/StrS family aminotransferase [Vibrio vulnificus]